MSSELNTKRHRESSTWQPGSPIWADLCNSSKPFRQEDFERCARYLSNRKKPVAVTKLFPKVSTPILTWGLPTELQGDSDLMDHVRLVRKLKKKATPKDKEVFHDWIGAWLAKPEATRVGASEAIQCLAWAYALPRLATRIPAQLWRELLWKLLQTVEEAEVGSDQVCGWSQLLTSGELPLVLAYQLPELPDCQRLAKPASRFVSQCMEQWFDGQGLPHANNLVSIRPLLATLTRSFRICRETEGAKLRKSALSEFDWFVRQTLRLTRCDLTSAMTSADESTSKKSFTDLFQAALSVTKDKQDVLLFQTVLHAYSSKSVAAPEEDELPDGPSYQSDWSDCAVLQPSWSPAAPRLSVLHGEKTLRGEFSIGRKSVFVGDLTPSLTIDRETVTIQDKWECVCWFADDDVDMLEIRTTLSNGWKLERQYLMAREDQFLFTADVLAGPQDAQITYHNSLPLCEGITFRANAESNEGFLAAKSRLGLVMPLALPEWRDETRNGSLSQGQDGLHFEMTAFGSRLYAPLFIDFHRRRMRATSTWRRLTIADQLRIVKHDEAVGYRIQAGIEQWLIYRSLQPTTSRTVLGQHLSDEFVCGRFLNDGTIEALVEVASGDPNSVE